MSSLSPNKDARRTSPRKSAGRVPHYLARETNKQKGCGGVKKSGGGVKKRAAKESNSSSDDDSDSDMSGAKPRKKSGGTKSIEVSRRSKVAKVGKSGTGRVAAKGKKTLDYGSDDFSSSSNDSTLKATMGKHSVKELLEKIEEKDKIIRSLELELSKSKVNARMNKTKVRENLKWTGEETNFSESVNHFCWNFLFPKFKFLKDGWKEILPDQKNSFYSFCMRHLMKELTRKIFGRGSLYHQS
jgi:hypothetical protein